MARFNKKKKVVKKHIITAVAEDLIDKLGDEYTFRLREDADGEMFISVYLRYLMTRLYKIYDMKGMYGQRSAILLKDMDDNILESIEYDE